MLRDFLGAAFPWIIIGLFAAFACAFLGKTPFPQAGRGKGEHGFPERQPVSPAAFPFAEKAESAR